VLNAINNLTILQFVLLVLATFTGLVQLALLAALALRGASISTIWGVLSVVFWITFFVVTR
jgi:predicted exporter